MGTDTLALETVYGARAIAWEFISSHSATDKGQSSSKLRTAARRGAHAIRARSRRHNCGGDSIGGQPW